MTSQALYSNRLILLENVINIEYTTWKVHLYSVYTTVAVYQKSNKQA